MALPEAVAHVAGNRRQRPARRGLPAAVGEGAAQERRGVAVGFVPRREECLEVLVEIDVQVLGRRLLGAHARNLPHGTSGVRPRREDVGVIALHAVWSRDSQLCVWGEDSGLPARAPKRRGRRPAKPQPREHPFACAVGDVAGALASLAPDAPQLGRELYLLLPSFDDGPQHSPQLLPADDDRRLGKPALLHSWVVPAIGLGPAAALELLLALPPSPPPGLALGDSLRFLAEAGKLALELVARGRVLPGLARRDEGWDARWRPVTIDPDDAERVRMLVAAMPPLVRAELFLSEEGNPPEAVVGDLLGSVVDACARSFLPDGLAGSRSRRGSRRALPAVDAWLEALTGSDSVVGADAFQLAALAEQLEEWRCAGERYAEHRMFRTCFRLCEPDELEPPGSASWRVDFLLQAKDDPSLLVPAAEVWSSNGRGLEPLGRRIADPQERLLGGLGHAVRLWPELEPALRAAAPTGLDLTPEATIGFLRDAAPALEQAGFGVLAPPWWSQRLRLRLEAEPLEELEEGSGLFGLEGLCAYEWKIAVGDATLSLHELRELAALKLPLVMARGRWIVLRPEDVEAALAFFARRAERGEAPAGELLHESLGLGVGAQADLPLAEIEAGGWLKELLGTNGDRKLREVPTPATFEGELRPYQQRGLAWLSFLSSLGLGACLADDMGLGKTVQLLALLLAEREQTSNGSGTRRRTRLAPTLLICPMSVAGNWQREAERFAPKLRVHVHHGRERLAGKKFARVARASDLVVTTYALATRDRETLGAVQWERIALDEAQNIKTIDTKQTRAIRSLPARHRVALTGTPVENRLIELHSIMDFLNPGLLGPAATFKRCYARPIERWRDEHATARLRRATRPFILRRLKTDKEIISDLPEKIEMRVDCHLTKEQASLYQAVVDEMLEKAAQAEGIERSGIILAALMKLKQVCNHPTHLLKDRSDLDGRSGKLARLEEILAEALAEGDRALCFTQFAEFGHMLRGHLQERLGREVLFLHGGTPKSARDEMVQRFQSAAGPPVFVLSLKAGGTGLNLTAANHVIHFDRWWNPAVEDQATDRAFRIGQRKNVQVRKLTCVGTLEERIDTLIAQKKDLADRIVGTGEAWLTELDTARLRELVSLSADAVAD
ncbi:MAG: DEAD/DEAH box helicase [Actinobacteria bacterium]|nr:DEAD/DEAH box helicase [Actinomycetota bacterium]